MAIKERMDEPRSIEIMPNYIRRAMGIWGRRVIISPEAQLMMRYAHAYQALRNPRQPTPALMHAHQLDIRDSLLAGVNSRVITNLPEGGGK